MRRLVLGALLVACLWVFASPSYSRGDAAFDPLSPRGREVERALEERRFAEALPVARELQAMHPDDAVITYWIAEIFRGLGNFREEADAWKRVVDLTSEADAACPAWPDALANAGESGLALEAYERCTVLAPDDPERWRDLATAYARQHRAAETERSVATARTLDPTISVHIDVALDHRPAPGGTP